MNTVMVRGRAFGVAALAALVALAIAAFCFAGSAWGAELSAASEQPAASGRSVSTQASSYKGLYEYTYGDPSSWGGTTSTTSPGYTLQIDILKKKSNKLTFKIAQFYYYGTTGYYQITSKRITANLKKGKGSFTFKTVAGNTGKGRVALVSKKKIKLRLKTISNGNERMPFSTFGKYKVLKRAKYQYRIY